MKVLQINSSYKFGGSTGRIAFDLKHIMENNGIESYAAYGINRGAISESNTLLLQSKLEMRLSQLQGRLFSRHGFNNKAATKRLLNYIDEIKPDLIHIHNIHGFYIHCGMLFDYIKTHNLPVVWTLHDCWSFTGWCAYFDYAECGKWKDHCFNCKCKKDYPKAWISSRSKSNFDLKKKTFNGVKNLHLVTPSHWLSSLTRESFLRDYPVTVINNGVDVNVFKPTANSVKRELGIEGKKMLLAVAGGLARRKGSKYLVEIPEKLNEDEVLIILGIKANQKSLLPSKKCIGIPYTNSVDELAAIYTAADVFINTTLEDNFPTTNIEAMSCGTPIITFNTGGSPEPVLDGEEVIIEGNCQLTKVGGVVNKGDVDSLLNLARSIIKKGKGVYESCCIDKAVHLYNKRNQYLKYVELYKRVLV